MSNQKIATPLLSWYETQHRPLPWRENIHPYTTWISEIMAQQTRINQLLPFYKKFLIRFPDVETLAAASQEEVLTAWAGMGYYTRAHNLHAAAKIIAKDGFPRSKAEWLKIPGVGEYTAGAIASIVYGERTTAIDGNALRVYARLANDNTDIASPAAKKSAALFFENAMPYEKKYIQLYNQAIMELGALICVPANPVCENCPLQKICQAWIYNTVHALPVKKRKKPSPVIPMTVVMVIDPGCRVLVHKRKEKLLNGMFIYGLEKGQVDLVHYANALGFTILSTEPVGGARHIFTHRVWDMNGYAVHVAESTAPEGHRFLSKDEIKTAPFPAAVRYFTEWFLILQKY